MLDLPLPDKAARLAILKIHTRGKPLAKGISLQAIADAAEGHSGADLAAMCNKAALLAIREYLESRKDDAEGYKGFAISKGNINDARKIIERQRRPS